MIDVGNRVIVLIANLKNRAYKVDFVSVMHVRVERFFIRENASFSNI